MSVDAATGEAAAPAHEHDWRQRAVLYEDGRSTEELGCSGCEGVWFR
ncbi:hypothetical protein [Nocardioides sp. SR21]|nr:hypothetical protein [Nocardioides sp. SR21]